MRKRLQWWRAATWGVAVFAWALLGFGGLLPAQGPSPPSSSLRSPVSDDPRSTILLRYDCESEVGRREVTLFGDGTVRLRHRVSATETGHVADRVPEPGGRYGPRGSVGPGGGSGDREMRLYDLDPDSLDAYRARLAEVDLSEVELERSPVEGEWVERCVLEVLRDGGGKRAVERSFRFSSYSALPLELSRLVRVAEDLIAEAEESTTGGLPSDYTPRPGDVLERVDGVRFEVISHTADGKGVELLGIDAPLVLYLTPDDLRRSFVRVLERGEDGGDDR